MIYLRKEMINKPLDHESAEGEAQQDCIWEYDNLNKLRQALNTISLWLPDEPRYRFEEGHVYYAYDFEELAIHLIMFRKLYNNVQLVRREISRDKEIEFIRNCSPPQLNGYMLHLVDAWPLRKE